MIPSEIPDSQYWGMQTQALDALRLPGIQPAWKVDAALRNAAHSQGLHLPDPLFFGWPAGLLHASAARFDSPQVFLFGALDAEGIWAGCLCGLSQGGMDFLATFNWLWNEQPELAARQSFSGLEPLCQSAGELFGRPGSGLFIYRNEFYAWRDAQWSADLLRHFAGLGYALTHGLHW
ncbi:MAG: hypothetical protein AB1439_03495 [candidate division FCPU426 bacterium]